MAWMMTLHCDIKNEIFFTTLHSRRLFLMSDVCFVNAQDPFAEEHPADDQLLIPNKGSVQCQL